MALRVVDAAGMTLVQDAGRPGMSSWGVGTSGAFDRRAMRQANALLGNENSSAVLESLGGGLALVATAEHAIAVTGAAGPVWLDGAPVEVGAVRRLAPGGLLRLGAPTVGLRWTLAVAGGIDTPRTLGSRARDTLSGLGPEPLDTGDLLSIGFSTAIGWGGTVPVLLPSGAISIRVVLGPRDAWFTPAAVARFLTTGWQVDALSDRVGIRLDGPVLDRRERRELLSEPMVRGSVQVTNSGRPIVLGPDHPVTGGYPVIAVVTDQDTDLLAQARPGDVIHFERTAPRP